MLAHAVPTPVVVPLDPIVPHATRAHQPLPLAPSSRRPAAARAHTPQDIFAVLASPHSSSSPRPPRQTGTLPAIPATDTWTWLDLEDSLLEFIRSPTSIPSALAADARAAGVDFDELDHIAAAATSSAGHRQPATVSSHVTSARRWTEWFSCWSPSFRSSTVASTLHLALTAYIRARRAVPNAAPPPSPQWPRDKAHPAPGPFVKVTTLETEVGRFLGLLGVFQFPRLPWGGRLVKAVLTAFGALDKNKRSPKSPLWVWQLIATYQRLWTSVIRLSADAASGFSLLCLIAIGTLRPGFASALLSSSVSLAPLSVGIPAFLIEWFGIAKTRPGRLPPEQGGPPPPAEPVITCVAHDLLAKTAMVFRNESRAADRPSFPAFSRCRRVPDSALLSAHHRHLFTWAGSLWEATSRPWSHSALTRLARDLLTRAGFPDALPFASGPHASRLAGSIEHDELATPDKVRDVLGNWAILKRRQHEHYEAVAIERMARATACLGRLHLTRQGFAATSLGLPATIDLDAAKGAIRALGPVDADAPVDAWIPGFLASFAAAPPPHTQPSLRYHHCPKLWSTQMLKPQMLRTSNKRSTPLRCRQRHVPLSPPPQQPPL